jgi:hypothetical protein
VNLLVQNIKHQSDLHRLLSSVLITDIICQYDRVAGDLESLLNELRFKLERRSKSILTELSEEKKEEKVSEIDQSINALLG